MIFFGEINDGSYFRWKGGLYHKLDRWHAQDAVDGLKVKFLNEIRVVPMCEFCEEQVGHILLEDLADEDDEPSYFCHDCFVDNCAAVAARFAKWN